MDEIKEVNVDDPEFEKYIAQLLKDKCLSRLCENDRCPFFNDSNLTCNIGYPEHWYLYE